ncbi:MAG: DUF169 domain-containing protein [Calditrichia bacterium]
MQPDPSFLLEKAGISLPPVGLYDAPDSSAFIPLASPAAHKWSCLFMFYQRWLNGETLYLKNDNFGCGGVASYLLGKKQSSRKETVDFLFAGEGLKASEELTGRWVDQTRGYSPQHDQILIGPLRPEQYPYLKTVSFFLNPDQLSLFVTGAYYRQGPPYPALVTVPFASGCGLLAPLFEDLNEPRAIIGATDIAMRQHLPPDILLFTVTKPMFEQLCALDESSFLQKHFWEEVKQARKQ